MISPMWQTRIYHAVSLSIFDLVDNSTWFGILLDIDSMSTEMYEYMLQPESKQVGDILTLVL